MTDIEDRRRKRLQDHRRGDDHFVPTPSPTRKERRTNYVSDDLAYELFSHIADATEDNGWSGGLTRVELCELMGFGKIRFQQVRFHMSRALGDDAVRVIPIQDPDGEYRYRVIDDPAAAEEWRAREMQSIETRVETFVMKLDSLAALTDGRTLEGKRLRIWARSMHQGLDAIALIDELETVH